MSKILRKTARLFGSASGFHQVAKFGSLAAGSPVFSTDPDVIQSLPQFLSGWYAAVIGDNSPTIQDMNALCLVYAYQLAYLMQAGIAEWSATTTYYIGSLANVGGIVYASTTDNNLNNAVTDATHWMLQCNAGVTPISTDNYNVSRFDREVNYTTSTTNMSTALPTAVGIAGTDITLKKLDGSTGSVSISTQSAQTMDGRPSGEVVLRSRNDFATFRSDGANWDIIAKKETYVIKSTSGNYSNTGTASGNFPTMSTNQVSLTAGQWRLSGKVVVGGGGGGTNYGIQAATGFYAANGGNSATVPALLSTVAEVTGETNLNSVLSTNSAAFLTATGQVMMFEMPNPVITLTSTQSIYLVPQLFYTTNGNTIVEIVAERIW